MTAHETFRQMQKENARLEARAAFATLADLEAMTSHVPFSKEHAVRVIRQLNEVSDAVKRYAKIAIGLTDKEIDQG